MGAEKVSPHPTQRPKKLLLFLGSVILPPQHSEGRLDDDQSAGGNAGRYRSHPPRGSNLDEQRPSLGGSGRRWHPKLFRTASRFWSLNRGMEGRALSDSESPAVPELLITKAWTS